MAPTSYRSPNCSFSDTTHSLRKRLVTSQRGTHPRSTRSSQSWQQLPREQSATTVSILERKQRASITKRKITAKRVSKEVPKSLWVSIDASTPTTPVPASSCGASNVREEVHSPRPFASFTAAATVSLAFLDSSPESSSISTTVHTYALTR